jgi:CCR4-NOT transcriptional regulation complex NOT5 subunit
MPGKSRHHRGKHALPSKKKKSRRSPQAAVSQQKAASQIREPIVAPPKVAAPSPGVSTSTTTTVKHPELPLELQRIAILAGIMLTALILLSLFLD